MGRSGDGRPRGGAAADVPAPGALGRVRTKIGHLLRAAASVPAWALAAAVGALALAVRIPLILAEHLITPGGDSSDYVAAAADIANGNGLGDAYRTPGYPMIIALTDFLLPGGRIDNIVNAQHVAAAVFAAVLVLVTARWFDRATALVAGLMFALTPASPYLEHAILSNFPFAILVFGFAAVLASTLRSPRPPLRSLVALGVLAAAAAYVRPAGQALILAVVATTALATRDWRNTLRTSGVVVAVFALLVVPWVARNAAQFDAPAMSRVTGDTLFVRAFEVDKLEIPRDRPSGRLAADVAATRGDERLVTAVTLEFQAAGLTRDQTLRTKEQLARTAIWRNPWTYAWGTLEQVSELRVDPREVNLGSDVGPHIPEPPSFSEDVWNASEALTTLWWTLSLGLLAGVLVLFDRRPRARQAGAALLATWLVLALATSLSRGALTRYALELAPIAFALGSYGAITVLRALADIVTRSSRPGTLHTRPPGPLDHRE